MFFVYEPGIKDLSVLFSFEVLFLVEFRRSVISVSSCHLTAAGLHLKASIRKRTALGAPGGAKHPIHMYKIMLLSRCDVYYDWPKVSPAASPYAAAPTISFALANQCVLPFPQRNRDTGETTCVR